VSGTRLGRQSNSAKLSTLMQYQPVSTTSNNYNNNNNDNSCSSNRPAQLRAGNDVGCHGDDQSAARNISLSPMATRSNSDAARMDTDTEMRSRDTETRSQHSEKWYVMEPRSSETERSCGTDWTSRCHQLSADSADTADTVDTSAIAGPTPDNACHYRYGQYLRTDSRDVCGPGEPCGTVDTAVAALRPDDASRPGAEITADELNQLTSRQDHPGELNQFNNQFTSVERSSVEPDQFSGSQQLQSKSLTAAEVNQSSEETVKCCEHDEPADHQSMDHPDHHSMDADHAVDHDCCDQMLLRDPDAMLRFMAEAFRELDEIMNRVLQLYAVCLSVCLS